MSKATRRFIVNKVLEMLITLVVVTLISFLLVRLSPIDPAEAYARRSYRPLIRQKRMLAGHLPHLALRMSRWRRCGKIWASMTRCLYSM